MSAMQVIEVGVGPAVHPGALRRHRAAAARSRPDAIRLAAAVILVVLLLFGMTAAAVDLAGAGAAPPGGPARGLDL